MVTSSTGQACRTKITFPGSFPMYDKRGKWEPIALQRGGRELSIRRRVWWFELPETYRILENEDGIDRREV